jgi:putative protease
MKREIELLAPGGDVDSIKAAILAGADAIYCGLDKFNARNRAKNITLDDLKGILRLAHKNDCEIFLTVNIIIVESEFPALINLLNKLVNTKIDGIIIQDFGLFYLLSKYFPSLKIHASTQLTTHNEGQIRFLRKLAATRVNLSRELNIDEIKELTAISHENNVLTEVFVHGSNCISFSGLCYMSSVHGGNSGNRGRCSQPCRDQYLTTAEGKDFPLNIKDNSAYSDLRMLYDAGVDSIKIEGRIKKYHYVYTVVDTWRKQLQGFYEQDTLNSDDSNLRKVFNRDFSNSFLTGEIGKGVFSDNPRDNSAIFRSEQMSGAADVNLVTAKRELYDIKTEIITNVKDSIDQFSIDKAPLIITVSGECETLLKVSIRTPEFSFDVHSISILKAVASKVDGSILPDGKNRSNGQSIDQDMILKRFKVLNDTEYFIEELDLSGLHKGLIIPFKELSSMRSRVLYVLNGSKESFTPVVVPLVNAQVDEQLAPSLSLLLSSEKDLHLCAETTAEIYFQLPNSLNSRCSEFIALFMENQRLIPWFPAVLIGEDYRSAETFLQQVKPKRIVTNNTGVAYAAYQMGIEWVAGPYMNLVNSFSLLCLKEHFNCSGAFLSNEINKEQIRRINKPEGFKLYYSLCHPVVLMTTRVCMFHQVTGCKKNIVDDKCMQRCEKSSFITNLKQVSFFIDKAKGDYHSVYNEANFLNTDIVSDIPHFFSNFFIDLREVKTGTHFTMGKSAVVKLFERVINGGHTSAIELNGVIYPSTNTQYIKGI